MRASEGVGAAHDPAEPAPGSPYWRFYEELAASQVAAWAPTAPSRILDLSGGRDCFAELLVAAGHEVVHVNGSASTAGPGRLVPVRADARSLGWLRDGCVDAVLAESRALSMCLAAEVTAEELLRVLRPGGRLLLNVDSLLLGLSRLANQGRWAELADVPAADLVLVPATDGTLTRCFWSLELAALLTAAGFTVEWVRPRSVLSVATVERALSQEPSAGLRALVRTELALEAEHEGESTGIHLIASARRPA